VAVGGALVVGAHEEPPAALDELEPWLPCAYRRRTLGSAEVDLGTTKPGSSCARSHP
jgi:hypothetical protein